MCAAKRDYGGLNHALVEAVMACVDGHRGARELKARPWEAQYSGLGASIQFVCVQRAKRVEGVETDLVKHKARNNGGSGSSFTGIGGDEYWRT